MNDATGDRILEVALGGKRRNRLEALSKRVA